MFQEVKQAAQEIITEWTNRVTYRDVDVSPRILGVLCAIEEHASRVWVMAVVSYVR